MMNPPKGGHSCVVRSCKSRSVDKNIRFFRLPKERSRAMAWLQASNRMDLKEKSSIDLYKNYKICALHFKKCMYTSPEKNRLLPTATPTEFDNAKTYYCKRSHSPSPEDSAKHLKLSSDDTTQVATTSDHTYHKILNTQVQEKLDKLISNLAESGPTTPKSVVTNSGPTISKSSITSKPKPSILKSVLTASNKPVETIDLTANQDSEPIKKCQSETSKVTQGLKSYLLIPKEFVHFLPKRETFVLPSCLPAPQHFLQFTSEPPKKTVNSTSIPVTPPEPPKTILNSTACIPVPSGHISCPPESPQKTINSTSSLPAPTSSMTGLPERTKKTHASNLFMRYAPEPPKQPPKSTSSLQVSTFSLIDLQERTKKAHAQTQTSVGLTSSLPKIIRQTKTIKSLYQKNVRLQKLLNNKTAPKPTLEMFSKYCDTFLTPPMAEFVKTQAQLCKVSEHGRRYNDEYKEFAEKMYSLGPRCYKYLQKLFCLPSIKSLQRDKLKNLQDQENGNLPQQPPVESLHHVTKEIKCLPSLNNEELQQTTSCINKPLVQHIKYFPALNSEQIEPIQISFEPIIQQIENVININEKVQPVVIETINHLSDNEQLEQAIKSLEPMTCLPDLTEL
ncbi:proteoglycan 4-like isoform X2 [Onthophagus taurus]|uniref:proteoglycan 4-like isoform X2 n=1 Tax=Onthophagus taurus TaxID=166361 RepID=UPI0039BEB9FB